MSEGVTFSVNVDTAAAQMELTTLMTMTDKAVAEMVKARQKIIRGVREGLYMVTSLISSYRQAISLIGGTIDPLFDAMLTMLSATVSMMLAIAAAYTSTIAMAPLGAVVAGIAIGLSILSWAKMMQSQAEIVASLAKLDQQMPRPVGGVQMGVGF